MEFLKDQSRLLSRNPKGHLVLEVVSVPNEYTLKIYEEFCGILYRLDYKMSCGILDKRNELDGLGGLLVETFYIK